MAGASWPSCRSSIIIFRQTRLRPAIWAGRLASGTRVSIMSGQRSPHIQHCMPPIDVPMIHEAFGWKVDVPDSLDATKLRDNVLNALTHCDSKKDQWPADPIEAYRAVTHSISLAIMDKPLEDSAQPAAGQLPADQGTQPQPVQPAK